MHAVDDKDLLNADGVEDESVGKQFLERIHGWPLWVQTSYNTRGGKHYKEDKLNLMINQKHLEKIMQVLVGHGMKIVMHFIHLNHTLVGFK